MRTALVTGASRGIGRGIAVSLARQGYGLTVSSRSESDLASLADDLRSEGAAQVVHAAGDMSDRSFVPRMVDLHDGTYGAMSTLIINAGVGTGGKVVDYDLGRLDKTLEVNFSAPFVLVQAALPLLRRGADADPEHGARVIGLASMTGVYAERGLAAYGASKAALISLLRTVALEEARHGVLATAIAPGYVETDMSEWVTHKIPASTMIRVSDVVAVVDMLLGLSGQAAIGEVVVARRDSNGFEA